MQHFWACLSLLVLGFTDSVCMPSTNMHAGWGVDVTAIAGGVPATLLARYLAKDMTPEKCMNKGRGLEIFTFTCDICKMIGMSAKRLTPVDVAAEGVGAMGNMMRYGPAELPSAKGPSAGLPTG